MDKNDYTSSEEEEQKRYTIRMSDSKCTIQYIIDGMPTSLGIREEKKVALVARSIPERIAGQPLQFRDYPNGYEMLLFDNMQHGAASNSDLSSMIRAIHFGGATAIVRVSGCSYHDQIQHWGKSASIKPIDTIVGNNSIPPAGSKFKGRMRGGEPQSIIFQMTSSPDISEILARMYDGVVIDMQHGAASNSDLSSMIRAIHFGGATAIVRVSGCSYHDQIQHALDGGCDGLMFPQVNTVDDAYMAIKYASYPAHNPEGARSLITPMAASYKDGVEKYVERIKSDIIIILQIETIQGIENVAEISKVKGFDIIFLGQSDLSMSHGLWKPGSKYEDILNSPKLQESIVDIVKAAKMNNKILGVLLFGSRRIREFIDRDFKFISLGNELHHIIAQAGSYLQVFEEITTDKIPYYTSSACHGSRVDE